MDRLELLIDELARLESRARIGRVSALNRGLISIDGLSDFAAPGDLVEISGANRERAEVVGVDAQTTIVLADTSAEGLRLGASVRHLGPGDIAPDISWIGRIIDPYGQPLDRGPLPAGARRQIRRAPPDAAQRRGLGSRLGTGLAVFNTFLPIVRGQRVGLFAGSGVGKSNLLGRLALGVEADVIVIALIGERGREVRDFTDRLLGAAGMARCIVVAATSDQPAVVRRRCIWTAMAVAEYFRDQGRHVLFLADSLTRFAEAHREIALAAGEPPTLRSFPPSTVGVIAAVCERAGPGSDGLGDITAIFTVLVAGSDMEEPVADMVRAVLDGHVILDRQIAERGRFPAVDLLRSVSRSLPGAASPNENALMSRARALLGRYERAEMMVQAGLYTSGSDPELDIAIRLWPQLDAFQAETVSEGIEHSFQRLEQMLVGAGAWPAP